LFQNSVYTKEGMSATQIKSSVVDTTEVCLRRDHQDGDVPMGRTAWNTGGSRFYPQYPTLPKQASLHYTILHAPSQCHSISIFLIEKVRGRIEGKV
jgi:hypothetical protein